MHHIVIQQAAGKIFVPKNSILCNYANLALEKQKKPVEVTIRIVKSDEMALLNTTYRNKPGPTNVLAFPFQLPRGVDLELPILGDIILCAEIINKEAQDQHKSKEAHWAHIIIHGLLHLQGYQHDQDEKAQEMELIEKKLLQQLGFPDPYEGENKKHHE